ncbi:MAG TPA: metallophosphoesterase [Tepidisphaeraceae bacterium]|jgi:3',5'-cyclic AMP phosphodiesterase CpdA
MRLLVTADLHYNHGRSKALAVDVIKQMNQTGGDALLLVGDTAVADGQHLEACLSQFTLKGPKLFLCGNHELWTRGPDSYFLFTDELPRRVRALGWRWLETEPLVAGGAAVVGTIGWYDYTFASEQLAIPQRFYQAKLSPGAAEQLNRNDLLADRSDITPAALEIRVRWNDGTFVKLHRNDVQFAAECAERLEDHLRAVSPTASQVVVATHHVPFRELLPPPRAGPLEFVKAYLGSQRLGDVIRRFDNVSRVFCGHSHVAARATFGQIEAVNLGSSYNWKTFQTLDLPD